MRYTNEQSFVKAYKSGERHNVCLLFGSETYLIELWAKKLLDGGDSSAFNFQRFDGRTPDLAALWDAAETLPLMAEQKQILLDGLEPAALSAQDIETFAALLGDFPESTLLVITAKSPDFPKSAAGKKLLELADRAGATVELGARSTGDLVSFLKSKASKQNCTLSTDVARYLLDICANDMQALDGELAKLCAYAGGEITRAHIDAVAAPKTEARVFDLQKLILAGNAQKALELLSRLFALREEPIAILGTLSVSFCDLYLGRTVRDAGGGKDTLMREFGYKSEYRAIKAIENSVRLGTGQLRRTVILLCECDRKMKSTGADKKIYLEQLVINLIVLCGEGKF